MPNIPFESLGITAKHNVAYTLRVKDEGMHKLYMMIIVGVIRADDNEQYMIISTRLKFSAN